MSADSAKDNLDRLFMERPPCLRRRHRHPAAR
jgi:hypothetical protein